MNLRENFRFPWMRHALILSFLTFAVTVLHARQEKLAWTNDGARLAGDLVLPETPGPHPALIFFHGSGDATRKEILPRLYATKLAANGIALLLFDKRGCGESTGNWRDTDFVGMARDGLAGITEMKKRSDIDPKKLGVIGQSEGGWLGPLAATLSSDVKFVVAISGPTISPAEQMIFYHETAMKQEGLSDDAIHEAITLVRMRDRMYETGQSAELEHALAADRDKPWFAKSPVRELPDLTSPDHKFYARVLRYDPVTTLKKLEVPLFAIYGEADVLVPGPKCARDVESIGKEMKITPKVLLIPKAAHDLRVPGKGFLPEYWDQLVAWLAGVTK